ncbi:uncharacterized protein [Diabrotica undecimpunctata]|uniref:uncharacterized protein n=1 Tax=Diabrotica undecimpunctata TaxID=50387 RepID=UPI003B63FD6D
MHNIHPSSPSTSSTTNPTRLIASAFVGLSVVSHRRVRGNEKNKVSLATECKQNSEVGSLCNKKVSFGAILNLVKMDLKDLCRLCLSRDKQLMWVFDDKLECTKYVKKLILKTVGVEINKDDVISQKICTKCGEDVLKLYHFREQSLKNDKLLKELYRNVRKKTMHRSVINLFKKYPGLKIPNIALDLNISPMVEMEMDEVQNYFRMHNINMAKHTQQVLRNESSKACCSSKDSSISKDTVSPISLKFVQDTSSYEIIHKTNNTEDDGRLQQEIINLISTPKSDPKRISSYGKRRNSLADVSPPHKKLCEAGASQHPSTSYRRKSDSNSKSEHLNNKRISNNISIKKSPVIISNILLQTEDCLTKPVSEALKQTNCNKMEKEICKTLSNDAKPQSTQTAGTYVDPEIQKSNQREKLDSSVYTNIEGIKPLSSTIIIDKTLCNDRNITSNLQIKQTAEIHDPQIPKSVSLIKSIGAIEHQVPIVDSTSPNSPPAIIHNIALNSSDISEKSMTEGNFKETAVTNQLIGARKEPNVVFNTDAFTSSIKLDFNRDFSPNKSKTITELESKIEISSPKILQVNLNSEDEKLKGLPNSSDIKNNLNNSHICIQDLLANSCLCVPKNNATADSSRHVEEKLAVTKNQNSNIDTRNGNKNSTEVVPEIIEILSDDEEQATSTITSSIVIPNITMPDNEFIDISSNGNNEIIINQLLSAIKDLPCPEKEAQTNISSQHLKVDKLEGDFKVIINDESITTYKSEYHIELKNFKTFLSLCVVPVTISNAKYLTIKYNINEGVKPKQEHKYWDDLIPIDIKLEKSHIKLEPPEVNDDQVLNSPEKISAGDIKPPISDIDNAAVNVKNIPEVTPEISLEPATPALVTLESILPTQLAQVSAESAEMTQSSNSTNVCLPQSTEKQITQEITFNDPGLELDIDATIRLNTEALADFLENISDPSSSCNNDYSNSAINSSHNLNVTPAIEANLINLSQPTRFPSCSNENVPVTLPSTSFPSLPELGLNIENFDSYIEAPVVTENLPIHANTFINSNTRNSTSLQLRDILSTIPRPPVKSRDSQNIHLNGINNDTLSNATELEKLMNQIPPNINIRPINNMLPNNPSNYQYYQHHINFNLNVYNNDSRKTPDIRPRKNYCRSQTTWVPPEQTNVRSHGVRPPPPSYAQSNYLQQGYPNSSRSIPTINNRNYNSNPPLNNYRQVNRPQSNTRNYYTPYPPNSSTNLAQLNSRSQNYEYFSERIQSHPSVRNNLQHVRDGSNELETGTCNNYNASNIRVRSINDLK